MASFIDDVIIGTEIEEGHDELVEEIVKRLANYLYNSFNNIIKINGTLYSI